MNDANDIQTLTLWRGDVEVAPLSGGITNRNFLVTDSRGRYFVRLGEDIPLHGVMRFNELQASLAAAELGLSPKVLHHQPGVLVLEFIEGETLSAEDVRDPPTSHKLLRCYEPLIKK